MHSSVTAMSVAATLSATDLPVAACAAVQVDAGDVDAPGTRRVEASACHDTSTESSGDSTEVQVDAGDVDATGHRKVDSSCSSFGSSGRVVPETGRRLVNKVCEWRLSMVCCTWAAGVHAVQLGDGLLHRHRKAIDRPGIHASIPEHL